MGTAEIIAIVGSIIGGSGLAGVLGLWIGRRKVRAEADVIQWRGQLEVVDASLKYVESLRQDLDRLLARTNKLEDHNDALTEAMARLKEENMLHVHKTSVLVEKAAALEEKAVALEEKVEFLTRENESLRAQLAVDEE